MATIFPGSPDFFTPSRYPGQTAAVELHGRDGGRRDSDPERVDVGSDGGCTWLVVKHDAPIGEHARVGWSFTWRASPRK